MEDDIFAQLSSIINPDKPKTASTGFGGTPGSMSHSSGSMEDDSYFEDNQMIVPDIKPRKNVGSKKLIIAIDDDFSALDLLKIYLQRDYDFVPFDNPKNAIFYLNGNIPDLIMVDCYLNVMNTKRLIEIIRTYKELADVPLIYLAEPAEIGAISSKLPDGVVDIISRPVKRGDLQRILDTYLADTEESPE